MQRDIQRLIYYLENFPDIDIWIISKTNLCAELYWDRLKEYVGFKKKPHFLSKGNYLKDGYNTFNALILLCGNWYQNPIAFSDHFRMHLNNAKLTMPIGEIPDPKILNAKNNGLNTKNIIFDEFCNH